MALYIRFMMCLAVGLVGVGLVVKTVIETLFHDWDVVAEIADYWRYLMSDKRRMKGQASVEDMLMDQEIRRITGEAPLQGIDAKRQALREVALVEHRLKRPQNQGPIVLTPMPSPRGAVNLTPIAPPPVFPQPQPD